MTQSHTQFFCRHEVFLTAAPQAMGPFQVYRDRCPYCTSRKSTSPVVSAPMRDCGGSTYSRSGIVQGRTRTLVLTK